MDYLYFVIGLLLLVGSGEVLVKGAVGISYWFKISPLVVGMTIVSFGTSAPELLVSLQAALGGNPDISIGNVIGSNVANLALVLGLTAIIFPIVVDVNSIRMDWPSMMLATILLFLFIYDNKLERWEGAILFTGLLVFNVYIIRKSRKKTKRETSVDEQNLGKSKIWLNVVLIIAGSAGLVFGSDLFVDGAVGIAKRFGVSDLVIGTTVVAFGTSVPELITSTIAAFRKQTDISIGNLIGSNLFNIAAILGITSLVTDIPVNEKVISFDIWWVLGISAIVLPMMLLRRKITRVKGLILVSCYVFYIYFAIYQ